jgi:Tfp pilus assembly protein PilE
MKTTRSAQLGMTLGGLIFVLGFIAILVLFAVRAFPLYNEKMQVVAAMNTVVSRPEAASMSEKELAAAFLRNIEATTNLQRFNQKNLKDMVEVVKPETKGEPKQLRVHYQATNVLFKDLHLMLNFDHRLPLRGNASGTGE